MILPLLCRKPVPTRFVAAQIMRTTECVATSPPRPAESVSIGAATRTFVKLSAALMGPPKLQKHASERMLAMRMLLCMLRTALCSNRGLTTAAELHEAMDRALENGWQPAHEGELI